MSANCWCMVGKCVVMPNTCCVRGCKSFMLGKKISLFRFPQQEDISFLFSTADARLCQLWLKAVHSSDSTFSPSSARVCGEHFVEAKSLLTKLADAISEHVILQLSWLVTIET